MSKSYNMAGWRVGVMVGNQELVNALARIKSYHDYGTFTPIQVASLAALEGPQECVSQVVEQYRNRRDVLAKGLHEAGWLVDIPTASMYIRSEEHTSELQSLMRISYAVFCLTNKNHSTT